MRKNVKSSYFTIVLIVIYVFLFEWQMFQADVLVSWTNGAKLLIPALMVVLVPVRKANSRAFRLFAIFFLIFMVWGLAPSLLAEQFLETISTWMKYASRLLFAFLVGLYLLRQPRTSLQLMKVLVAISVLTVAQFILLIIAYSLDLAQPFMVAGVNAIHYGPFGLLGNQTAVQYFSEIPFPVFRLTGFWFEPSNASGFLFACFFLAKILQKVEKKIMWRVASYVCLVGGFLALSNAGYLAIAAPTLFASIFMKKSSRKMAHIIVLGTLSVGLGYFAVQGRNLVNEQYAGSGELKALAGARAGTEVDAYGGRLELITRSVETLVSQPFGIGMRIPGEGHYEGASFSAPIQWLTFTGFIGLILLLLREFQVVKTAMRYSKDSVLIMCASQAWVAICTQHLVFGTWMTPFYLLLCLFVFSTTYHYQQNAFGDSSEGDALAPVSEIKLRLPSGAPALGRAATSRVS